MLRVVPELRAQSQFVKGRHMPGDVAHCEREQTKQGMSEKVRHLLERRRAEDVAQAVLQHGPRQPAQERQDRRAKQEQRRHRHHQRQMLDHMKLQ